MVAAFVLMSASIFSPSSLASPFPKNILLPNASFVAPRPQPPLLWYSPSGYLACARCSSTGTLVLTEPVATINGGDQPLSPPRTDRCSNCSGSGKVMCPTCLCTGMAMASEHDPRIDPFD
ncbi:hypothetical protein MUK42_03532 [Musa troglodytarum]|uniref:Uncharacterized protein n=1 Tax=Musa troglodytarum TaxID=320322 RepID=A0A9E7ELD2_9LILI|nr:hypothetical protein MUK42_03532 [Musa troglodytarum]